MEAKMKQERFCLIVEKTVLYSYPNATDLGFRVSSTARNLSLMAQPPLKAVPSRSRLPAIESRLLPRSGCGGGG